MSLLRPLRPLADRMVRLPSCSSQLASVARLKLSLVQRVLLGLQSCLPRHSCHPPNSSRRGPATGFFASGGAGWTWCCPEGRRPRFALGRRLQKGHGWGARVAFGVVSISATPCTFCPWTTCVPDMMTIAWMSPSCRTGLEPFFGPCPSYTSYLNRLNSTIARGR